MEARLKRRKTRRRLLRISGVLLIGSIIGVLVWQWAYAPSPPPIEASPTPEPTQQRLPTLSVRLTPPPPPELTAGTPADAWAEQVLAIAFPEINDAPAPLDGLAWWQSRDVNGVMAYSDRQVVLDDRIVDVSQQENLLVRVPDPTEPSQLVTIGEAVMAEAVLNLSTNPLQPPFNVQRWVVSSGGPQIALQALGRFIEQNDLDIVAAYAPNNGQAAELALIALERPLPTPAPTGTILPTLTPHPTRTPTRTPEPTPTREPDVYLSRLVGATVDDFVDIEGQVTSNAVYEFAFGHPRTGVLTWTEFGGRIGGREMALRGAEELNIYSLMPEDTGGSTQRIFRAVYDEGVTRVPAEQVYFQGQRMDEVVYWMVRRAFERGGQLVIVYDDFGATQSITLIGFEPFTTPR